MKKDAKNFLVQLVEAHGSPGYELGVQKIFRERVKGCDKVETDVLGSVIAAVHPEGSPRLLFDGHSDEIGFLVHYIDDCGFLYVQPSGGWDTEVVVSQRVLVHTRDGAVTGVFGKKAVHLMDQDERNKKSELHQMWIDIGAKDGEQARQRVAIGDFVTMDARFVEVMEGKAVAKSFDNRGGIFVVAETLRSLTRHKPTAAVFGVSAVQEEIGLRGAQAAAYAVHPQIGIAVDVTHATDHPDANKKKAGDIKLGGGPVICRGPNINPKVHDRLVEVARQESIPYQLEADPRGTGTDANPIQLTRGGVAAGLVSIPLRYMHNPCEMAALSDLDNTVRLLTAFALSVTEQDNWIPGL
ncbi:MAG: M42 family metallopeptidase [Armatimonadetes bacterium]|nr:M42 family metallopeptidase [Armatimonadota bacterium]